MQSPIPLRPLLWFDAATCLAMGTVLIAAADPQGQLLGLPRPLLLETGIILLPFALFVAWAARRAAPAGPARLIIAANSAWSVASLAVLVGPWLQPTPLGIAFVLVQAAAVAGIAVLQAAALRTRPATA